MVKGYTNSRLSEVRGYGGYEVGKNGLLEYSSTRARYTIGGILYVDDFINGTTHFYYVPEPVEESRQLASEASFDDVSRMESYVKFSRRPSSPFQSLYRLSLLENSDTGAFPENFFT